MNSGEHLDLSDSSSSDDSDIEDLLHDDDDCEIALLLLAVNNVGNRVWPERNPNRLEVFLQTCREIKDKATHKQLVNDLIQHHWQLHGQRARARS
jgi:hypothetical protein